MKEIFQQTQIFWKNYWGQGLVMWLFLAAILFLLIFRRQKKHEISDSIYSSRADRIFLSGICKGYSEMYWKYSILACAVASSGNSVDRICHDGIFEGTKESRYPVCAGFIVYSYDYLFWKRNL